MIKLPARAFIVFLGLWCMAEAVMPAVADASVSVGGRQSETLARRPRRCTRSRCRRRTRRTRAAATVPPSAPTGPRSIVIDLSDQTLYRFENGALTSTLPVSTGSGRPYTLHGRRFDAQTPQGNFSIGAKIRGYRRSALGTLYYPSYFVGGFAIHGGHLPGYPASHGCVRIPMGSALEFFAWAVPGTPVTVQQ